MSEVAAEAALSPTLESLSSSELGDSDLWTFSDLLEAIGDLPAAGEADAVYRRIAASLQSLVPWQTFSVLLLDEMGRLYFRWTSGHRDDSLNSFVFGPGQGMVGHAARGETRCSAQPPMTAPALSLELLPGHDFEVAVPLCGRDRVVGVLALGRTAEAEEFGEHARRLTELIGRHLGRAIESGCAHSSTRRLARNLSLLQEAGRELTSILDREQLFERIADMLSRLIDYQLFCVLLWNEERQRLEEVFVRRENEADGELPGHLRLGEGLCGSAAVLRQSIRVGNVSTDARFVSCGDPRIRSALAVPLMSENRLLGVFSIESYTYNAFSPELEQMLATLGSSIGVALMNAELYEQLRADEQLMAEDLETARSVQRLLLPRKTPWAEGMQLGVASATSRHLGGDLYDFFPYGENRTAIALGDVAGKGTAAALYASLTSGILRSYAQESLCQPSCVLAYLHDELRQLDVQRRFLAFTFAVFDRRQRTLTVSNAGLPYPLLLRDGVVREIEASGIPLGAMEGAERSEVEVSLEPGDVVLFASDGLEECLNAEDQPFGDERLASVLSSNESGSATEIAEALLAATDDHLAQRGVASDDRTAIVLKITA